MSVNILIKIFSSIFITIDYGSDDASDSFNITRIEIGVLDSQFNYIAQLKPSSDFCSYIQQNGWNEHCLCSDQELLLRREEERCAQRHICHAGLVDYAFPIVYKDSIMGYIIMGRVRSDTNFEKVKEMHVSKNMLYKLFDISFHCSVNEYVTDLRINEAKRLLSDNDKTVAEICETVGIWNYSYFCRLFKRKTGLTPIKYRQQEREALKRSPCE